MFRLVQDFVFKSIERGKEKKKRFSLNKCKKLDALLRMRFAFKSADKVQQSFQLIDTYNSLETCSTNYTFPMQQPQRG